MRPGGHHCHGDATNTSAQAPWVRDDGEVGEDGEVRDGIMASSGGKSWDSAAREKNTVEERKKRQRTSRRGTGAGRRVWHKIDSEQLRATNTLVN